MEQTNHYSPHSESPAPDTLAAVQMFDLFSDPDHGLDRIVEFISHNPPLAAETLRRCNTTGFSGGEPTTDIFEAVCRLGYYELYSIIAAMNGSRSPAPTTCATPELKATAGEESKFIGNQVFKKTPTRFSSGGIYL
jgi:HD-like signal output (HDOD) protein